jgi:putative ABC transport system permease protein
MLAPRVLTLTLLAGFAAIALVRAALGIYGVLSYSVTRRTRELAVRAALGAQTRDLLRLIVVPCLRTATIGVVLGLIGAALLTRMMSAMLVGIGALDPVSFSLAVAVLCAATLAAMLIPARRASRLDPMIALQSE